jgi:hypothetical protein
LNAGGCALTDADLEHLSTLTGLEVLVLSDTPLAGPGLACLKPLERLRVLNLSRTEIRDDCLVHLEGAPSLRMFYVRGTSLTTGATEKLDATLHSCSIYH